MKSDILGQNEHWCKKWGNGRNISGPAGYKTKPAYKLAREKGVQMKSGRKRPIWILYAHQGNSYVVGRNSLISSLDTTLFTLGGGI